MINETDIEAMKPDKRWVKVPGPGEFRGEGKWMEFEETTSKLSKEEQEIGWDFLVKSKYLPTAIQPEKPDETKTH